MYRIYEPQEPSIVLGAGRKAEADVFVERAQADGVPILRRRGGGGTVVLSPGQLVLALVREVASPFHNREYFRAINNWFRLAVERFGMAGIEDRGISDLAIRELKILGTSLYRGRRLLFYQASLLLDSDLELFDRYLRFPSRVPDYRRGRGHSEFCTTLRREGFSGSMAELLSAVEEVVAKELFRLY